MAAADSLSGAATCRRRPAAAGERGDWLRLSMFLLEHAHMTLETRT